MFKNIFNKKQEPAENHENSLICALLIHAAKMDGEYTEREKNIIKKAISNLFSLSDDDLNKTFKSAEELQGKSNQIIDFTREIKKRDMNFRLKIIEILWRIVYSDKNIDAYESTLIRRVCGLLYVSDFDSGKIKKKINEEQNK